jgi:uncharacterized membrane protein required for colicin V production
MLPASLTTVDAIVLTLIALGALQGFLRGLSGEMARLLGALCAFVVAAIVHEPLGLWVADYTRLVDQQARTFTYIATAVLAIALWALFNKLIRTTLRLILAPEFDKAVGVPAGMLRMTAWTGLIFITMNIWPGMPGKQHFNEHTLFGRLFIRLVPAVKRQIETMNLPLLENERGKSAEESGSQHHAQEENQP